MVSEDRETLGLKERTAKGRPEVTNSFSRWERIKEARHKSGVGMRSSGSLRLGCSRNIYNQIKLPISQGVTSQQDDCVY